MSWYPCVAVWVCVTVPELQIKYQLCSPSVTCQTHRGQQASPNKIMINPPPASNTNLSPLTMTVFTLKETVHRVRVEKWVVSNLKREIGLIKKKVAHKAVFYGCQQPITALWVQIVYFFNLACTKNECWSVWDPDNLIYIFPASPNSWFSKKTVTTVLDVDLSWTAFLLGVWGSNFYDRNVS